MMSNHTSRLYDIILSDDRFFLAAIETHSPREMANQYARFRSDFEELQGVESYKINWRALYSAIKNIGGQVEIPE